jgi:tetratricopeptide (TPR) repeat protein
MPERQAVRIRALVAALPVIVFASAMRSFKFLMLLVAALAAPLASAQSDATTDPREFSEAARKVYAQSLRDARTLIAEKKYADAIAALDKLSVERPREPQARFLKGLALADSGKTNEAIAIFQSVLGDYPELPEPHNNLAVLYAQKGDYELARNELEAAISAAPDYTIAYENLGDVYARLAALNYEKAVARDARNRTAPLKLKLVRDVLAPTATATTAPAVAPVATPGAPAPAPPAPMSAAPDAPTTATTNSVPPAAAPR